MSSIFESERPRVYGHGRAHYRAQREMRRKFHRKPLALDERVGYAIALALTRYRNAARKTQAQVAIETGIGDKTLSSFETGARIGTITLAQLNRLLTFYHVGFDRFLSDINKADQ